MSVIKSGIIFASATSLLALGACNSATDPKPAGQASQGPVAATVNGIPISQNAVDMLARQGAASGHPDTPEARKMIIDRLALQTVVAERP